MHIYIFVHDSQKGTVERACFRPASLTLLTHLVDLHDANLHGTLHHHVEDMHVMRLSDAVHAVDRLQGVNVLNEPMMDGCRHL
jgi:hypothetical protein